MFHVLCPKGKIIYTCLNKTKEHAIQEARAFCSSFPSYGIEDTTFRLLKKFKHRERTTAKKLIEDLSSEYPGSVRVRCVDYSLDGDTFEVEVWGTIDIDSIWRPL